MIDSGLIGKIEKAKRYAEEKDRISISKFEAKIRGENNDHIVTYDVVSGIAPVITSRGTVCARTRWEWN